MVNVIEPDNKEWEVIHHFNNRSCPYRNYPGATIGCTWRYRHETDIKEYLCTFDSCPLETKLKMPTAKNLETSYFITKNELNQINKQCKYPERKDCDITCDCFTIFDICAFSTEDLVKEIRSRQDLTKEIIELKFFLHSYKSRCEAIQKLQSKMRDPERKMIYDILANGKR